MAPQQAWCDPSTHTRVAPGQRYLMVRPGKDGKFGSWGSLSPLCLCQGSQPSHAALASVVSLRCCSAQGQCEQRVFCAVTVQPAKGLVQSSRGLGQRLCFVMTHLPGFVNSCCKLRCPFAAEAKSAKQKYPGVETKLGNFQALSSSLVWEQPRCSSTEQSGSMVRVSVGQTPATAFPSVWH